ncbi:17624_t:CDS:2 [Funneliformis caledonium]|uniref:17624_t:CDS:1 n=1 Tax=Funneliformis caledonium TaxID=1117310 RepID=A0A9N8ZMY6_9GLOM|nr:17624_t:CDS:2 [Funneliformis caledonium]
MKHYLTPHILSVQHQQILRFSLYCTKIVLKEAIDIAKNNDQHNYGDRFLEDQLDRPQISIFFLLERIQLFDIIEIWKLTSLTKLYKHYVILLIDGGHLYICLAIINYRLVCSHIFHLMMNSKVTKFNIHLIAKRWYLENIQDRDDQNNLQYECMEIKTQFQEDSNDNHELLVADLHILNQLRAPDTFTADVKQRVQRKEKYVYGFEKIKKTLNLALDLGCETEFIDMINGFINRKKNDIDDTNDENKENLSMFDPLVQKWRGRPPHKCIKLALENVHHSTKISALNPPDPNLQSSLRIPLHTYDVSNHGQDNDHMVLDNIGKNTSK